jgi:hypothetical protein
MTVTLGLPVVVVAHDKQADCSSTDHGVGSGESFLMN